MQSFEIIDGLNELTIKGPNSALSVFYNTGCNMYKLVLSGRDILQSPVDFSLPHGAYGMPIMFPFANRLKNAEFEFDGKKYNLYKHEKPVLMHGLVGDEKFGLIEKYADRQYAYATFRYENTSECENYMVFPFLCTLTVKFILENDVFQFVWEVYNKDSINLPFGLGVHTFFRKDNNPDRITIQVPGALLMEADDYYPTGRLIPHCSKKYDVSTERILDELELDTLYRIGTFPYTASIKYLDENATVCLEASENMKYMMVFTPHELKNTFCLESQTNATYGYNLYAEGKKEESGIIILEPGEKETGWVRIYNCDKKEA